MSEDAMADAGERVVEPQGEPSGELAVNGDAKANPPLARGKRRMRELSNANERDRAQLERDLLAEIGGTAPTILHRVAAEAMSATIINGRRQRAKGQSDADCLRQLAQLARAFGLKPAPAAPAGPMSIADMLAARGYAPPEDSQPTDDDDDIAEAGE